MKYKIGLNNKQTIKIKRSSNIITTTIIVVVVVVVAVEVSFK